MADAWAVQNHKYLYKKVVEGETHELTTAVSEIMNGCEKLWSLVKKKSLQKDRKKIELEISKIHKESEEKLEFIRETDSQTSVLESWFQSHQVKALKGLKNLNINAYMEAMIKPLNLNLNLKKKALKDGARNSTIETFGWPIGAVLENREEYAPKVDSEGIHAEISIKKHLLDESITYDYWAIHTNGAFYLLKSLFEDNRNPE